MHDHYCHWPAREFYYIRDCNIIIGGHKEQLVRDFENELAECVAQEAVDGRCEI